MFSDLCVIPRDVHTSLICENFGGLEYLTEAENARAPGGSVCSLNGSDVAF